MRHYLFVSLIILSLVAITNCKKDNSTVDIKDKSIQVMEKKEDIKIENINSPDGLFMETGDIVIEGYYFCKNSHVKYYEGDRGGNVLVWKFGTWSIENGVITMNWTKRIDRKGVGEARNEPVPHEQYDEYKSTKSKVNTTSTLNWIEIKNANDNLHYRFFIFKGKCDAATR